MIRNARLDIGVHSLCSSHREPTETNDGTVRNCGMSYVYSAYGWAIKLGWAQSITKKILDANLVLEITLLPRKPRLLDWTGDL